MVKNGNLTKEDGEVWFQNVWKEFTEHYSLADGHLLVFRYEKTSYFHVHVFDVSALEKDYPDNDQELHVLDKEEFDQNEDPSVQILVDSDDDSVADILAESDDESVEILDLIQSCRKRKEKSSVECIQPCKIMKTSEGGKAKGNPTLPIKSPYVRHIGTQSEGTNVNEDFHSSKTKREYQERGSNRGMTSSTNCSNFKVLKRRELMNTNRGAIALERATAFKSSNPFFKILMKPSYITAKSNLHIPCMFAMEYFNFKEKERDVIVRVSDGKVWPFTYICRGKHNATTIIPEFSRGWKAFFRGNSFGSR
ncbi:B3 domain-containing transcription factor VRN1-like protein [Quillaja saponaria]|uniref:B3 domain-containing transcription factor VRN1-like protein n=1 Tax=Quillaja saponaria TaxID=32244 RepID=A0AAD7LPW2_QUISA|nr:B3 domain-containing transcription factor VRN1-like protein [Quillaja saponaria]